MAIKNKLHYFKYKCIGNTANSQFRELIAIVILYVSTNTMKNTIKQFSKKKVSNLWLIATAVTLGAVTTLWIIDEKKDHAKIDALEESNVKSCKLKMYRKPNGNNLTHPLIMSDMNYESDCMANLKSVATNIISEAKTNNIITDASVYFRNLESGEWFAINDETKYIPGSLFKLPVLMTYLKLSESKPELLNSSINYDSKVYGIPNQTYAVESKIKPGNVYLIKMLLEEMAINSDNNATMLLNSFLDQPLLDKIFKDLEIPIPDMHNMNYAISAKDYSKLLRVLYNASYLNNTNSEYALQILTKSPFKAGIVKNLDSNTKCSHKFGEFGNGKGGGQLHESGIVFLTEKPYLITVMTKGDNIKILPEFIANLAKELEAGYKKY